MTIGDKLNIIYDSFKTLQLSEFNYRKTYKITSIAYEDAFSISEFKGKYVIEILMEDTIITSAVIIKKNFFKDKRRELISNYESFNTKKMDLKDKVREIAINCNNILMDNL